MEEWLIVDGYNIIGAWPHLAKLKQTNLAAARDALIETLSEYGAYGGQRVILVFDAHQVPGRGRQYRRPHVTVLFTEAEETADACIERLVGEMRAPYWRRLFVATSDYAEQRIAFGRGALRISARELLRFVTEAKASASRRVGNMRPERMTLSHALSDDVKRKLENWRREK